MGFPIVKKEFLNDRFFTIEVEAPHVLEKFSPGQFAMLLPKKGGEVIPLTVFKYNRESGTVTFLVEIRGKSTKELSVRFNEGDEVKDVIGPVGASVSLKNYGKVLLVGYNYGNACVYNLGKGLKDAENEIHFIAGFENPEISITADIFSDIADDIKVVDNGIKRIKEEVRDFIDDNKDTKLIVSAGIPEFEKEIEEVADVFEIDHLTHASAIMIDPIGLAGSDRVFVDGEVKYASLDGPWFDGHKLDYDALIQRNNIFIDYEKEALRKFEEELEKERKRAKRKKSV